MKSNLSEPGVKKAVKKRLMWADEKQQALVQTSFFEVDESERTNTHAFAHHCTNQISIADIEKLLERDLRHQQTSQDHDDRRSLPSLPPLIRIALPDTIHSPIVKSHQRIVQNEREQTALQALFIRSFLPDSPGEPDGDSSEHSTIETKLIPIEDVRIDRCEQSSNISNNIRLLTLIMFDKFEHESISNKMFNSSIVNKTI
jgi:hypothetical protein